MFRYLYSFLLLFIFASTLQAGNMIKDVEIVGNRLVLSFTKAIKIADLKQFTLKGKGGSARYVFDFKNTTPRDTYMIKKLSHRAIKSFRMSRFDRSTTRLVVEAKKPYKMRHKKPSLKKYSITLPSTRVKSKRATKRAVSETKPKSPVDLFISLFGKNERSGANKSTKSASSPRIMSGAVKRPKKRYTIVVDPGHGGKDSGALGTGNRKYMEKAVVLKIAKRVRAHLKALGFKVYMTRSSNRFVKLSSRTKFANRKGADAFVSIHANAVGKKKRNIKHGIETYYLQTSRSARSKRVAAMENSVVLRKKDRISKNVILNLMTGPKIVMSNKLAIDVQRSVLENLHQRYPTVKDNGVRPAPFWVLVGAQMPSVLVETGYITHPAERKRLFSPRYQDLIAKGIARGISNYFANREKEME